MALASPSLSSVLLEICFYLSAVFVHSAASLNATCYYPDGSVASSDTPCSSTGSSASCCEDKLYCLSNGLCLDIAHVFYVRGSCTDPTWPASSCPRRCLGGGLGGKCSSFLSRIYLISSSMHLMAWPSCVCHQLPALGYSHITEIVY